MRFSIVAISMLVSMLVLPVISTDAQVNMGVSIGVNVPEYPDLVRVPGYPVYYDPDLDSNYFFYDGQYWVYDNDNWYSSDWYNGPWQLIEPDYVPLFVLRVPVRYYRQPPTYFNGWRPDIAPHWGEHWGNDWEAHHHDWNHWDHQFTPRPAPLPVYQRQYSGDRYPHGTEQHSIRNQNYHYKPHEPVAQHGPQNNAHNNAVSRPVASHQPTTIQHQPQSRPKPQPNPQPNSQSRTGEQLHQQPLHQQPRQSPARQPSPKPPGPVAQHAQPPHMQPAHPSPRPPSPPHDVKPPPHDNHEEHGEDHR